MIIRDECLLSPRVAGGAWVQWSAGTARMGIRSSFLCAGLSSIAYVGKNLERTS